VKKYAFIILVIILSAVFFAACAIGRDNSGSRQPAQQGKITVAATIFPLYDFTRAVAGDKIELIMLLKPGEEIHSYEPSPADIIKVQNADMFFYIGGERDQWVQRILGSMDNSGKTVLKFMDCVSLVEEETVEGMEEEEEEEEEETAFDEHIWTTPANCILMIQAIAKTLAEADTANAAYYQDNADVYCARFNDLDRQFKEVVAGGRHKLLVFGDRFPFRYFADVYGLEYRAPFNGCSTSTDASAGTLAYLMNVTQENNLPYIYYIELSNENIARAICEQTGAGRLLFHSGQTVSREDFNAGITFADIMQNNVETLRKGLN